MRRRYALGVAGFATLLAMAWSTATVRYNYGGNWTALFCIGSHFSQPPELARDAWVFPHSYGYDGQFYRIVAHDPFFQRGWARYLDEPAKRYRRIALPAAAWTLALGRQEYIDRTYIACVWAGLFLGVFWTARFAGALGRNGWWGLAYLLVPSTVISLDRMLTDLPMVTAGLGFLYYVHRDRRRAAWICAAVAGLSRETGILFPLGYAAYLAIRRKDSRGALIFAGAAAPFAVWSTVVAAFGAHGGSALGWPVPFAALRAAFPDPVPYRMSGGLLAMLHSVDYLALFSMIVCGALIWLVREAAWRWIGGAFALLGLFMTWQPGSSDFVGVFNYGRQYSPLLLILLLDGLATGRWWVGATAIPIVVRTGAEFTLQIYEVARHAGRRE